MISSHIAADFLILTITILTITIVCCIPSDDLEERLRVAQVEESGILTKIVAKFFPPNAEFVHVDTDAEEVISSLRIPLYLARAKLIFPRISLRAFSAIHAPKYQLLKTRYEIIERTMQPPLYDASAFREDYYNDLVGKTFDEYLFELQWRTELDFRALNYSVKLAKEKNVRHEEGAEMYVCRVVFTLHSLILSIRPMSEKLYLESKIKHHLTHIIGEKFLVHDVALSENGWAEFRKARLRMCADVDYFQTPLGSEEIDAQLLRIASSSIVAVEISNEFEKWLKNGGKKGDVIHVTPTVMFSVGGNPFQELWYAASMCVHVR